ncbi:acetyl-CoA synthetase-like protein [Imleria badia]|nr:acetyl-CoA synthetase-like protein [Imleria badia]
MAELDSPTGQLPYIPDNVTLSQFILDSQHPSRPIRKCGIPWFIDDHTGLTLGYEEIRARVFGLANGLKHRFSILLIFSPNHIDYLVAVWAAHRLGAIVSGANPCFTLKELVYQIQATKASIIIAHPESLSVALNAARATELPAQRIILFNADNASYGTHITVQNIIDEGQASTSTFQERVLQPGEGKTKVAFLNFSSGTTGKQKAVAIPHYAPIANVIQLAAHYRVNDPDWQDQWFRPGDICSAVLPLYHIYGLVFNTHFSLFCGMPIVLFTKFHVLDFLNSVIRHRITHLMVVPPQVLLFCNAGAQLHAYSSDRREEWDPAVIDYDLSHVRYLTSGAAPLPRGLIERLIEIFPNAAIGQGYGTTESCTVITIWSLENRCDLSGSVGQLLPGITARVEKPDGTLAEFDEPGELVMRTPSLALGYAGDPEATQETFVNGWLRTGDLVKMNRKGEIYDMLKVRGFQVAPVELEGCILDHPDVEDTCVVGIPDEYSGELPLAFVVLRPHAVSGGPTAAETIKQSIIQHVADNKVGYKKLAGGLEFVDVIPKDPSSGKLLRRVLRDAARSRKSRPVAKF